MCIKDPINKTCWKNCKDLLNGAPKNKLWNHTKKTHFPGFAKNFRRPWMKLKIIFCQFPNPWTLRVPGMGGYTSKCEKKSKSLHPNVHWSSAHVVLQYRLLFLNLKFLSGKKECGALKVHKHEIIWNFFWPKSNPYMPFVNFEQNFASFPSIFARILMFEHFSGDWAYAEPNFFWEISKKIFLQNLHFGPVR